MFGSSRYNYDRFEKSVLLKDLAGTKFGTAPEPGDKAPDFQLRTLDGEKIKLSDFRGEKNVVLTFGSATCPLSAGSIAGLNELYDEYNGEDIQFLYVYVREAHPGENLPAHRSNDDKMQAAELFRDQEEVEMPILVDDLNGKVHRKYGSLPNPTFVIDKSGRISFRALATRASVLENALDELLERQKDRGVDHVVIGGGEDAMMPSVKSMLHAHRALERGGSSAIDDFRREMGMPGRAILTASRVVRPVADHPGAIVGAAAAVVGVVGVGLWAGIELRRRRLRAQEPYTYPRYRRHPFRGSGPDDYEAVGI
jgi:peroxiredoxin